MVHSPVIQFVDDDGNLLDSLVRQVKRFRPDWIVHKNQTPENALEAFRSRGADIVVTDFCMPGMDGLDLVSKMQALNPNMHTRFIMLTGSGDYSTAMTAINELNIARFHSKPFSCNELIDEIEACLKLIEDDGSQSYELQEITMGDMCAPVFILDDSARLIYSNQAADVLFQQGDVFSFGNDKVCRINDGTYRKQFEDSLKLVFKENCDRPIWLRLEVSKDRHPVGMVLQPKIMSNGRRVVSILLSPTNRDAHVSLQAIQVVFQLSAAEARIVLALTNGLPLAEAASASGVALSSARTYLKRAYQKTGTSSQAELVASICATTGNLLPTSR